VLYEAAVTHEISRHQSQRDGDGRVCAVKNIASGAVYGYIYIENKKRTRLGPAFCFCSGCVLVEVEGHVDYDLDGDWMALIQRRPELILPDCFNRLLVEAHAE
jgi:hypothetical protein